MTSARNSRVVNNSSNPSITSVSLSSNRCYLHVVSARRKRLVSTTASTHARLARYNYLCRCYWNLRVWIPLVFTETSGESWHNVIWALQHGLWQWLCVYLELTFATFIDKYCLLLCITIYTYIGISIRATKNFVLGIKVKFCKQRIPFCLTVSVTKY